MSSESPHCGALLFTLASALAGQHAPRTTTTPAGEHEPTPPIDYAHLIAAAGPWMAWFGIPLAMTPRRREGDRR